MDPRETLNRLRRAITALEIDSSDAFAADDAVTAFNDLDEWLRKGNYLPPEWEKAGRWNG